MKLRTVGYYKEMPHGQETDPSMEEFLNQEDPEQAEMIDGCSVDRHGMYIAMFISEKADKMREIYNTLLEF